MKFSISEAEGWKKAIVNNISFDIYKQHSSDIFFTSILMHNYTLETEVFARPEVTPGTGQKHRQAGRRVELAELSHDWYLTEELHKEQLQRRVNVLPRSSSSSLHMKTAG